MQIETAPKRPLNRWDYNSIRPGAVGSVGDALVNVKLRKSANYLPDRYDRTFSGKNARWSGSNVQDGNTEGFTSGGRSAVTLISNFTNRTAFKTKVGWVFENARPQDRSATAVMQPLGQYSYETKIARVLKAKMTGDHFSPGPNGYTPAVGTLSRGSQFPQIAAESSGVGTALPATDVKITDPIFGDTGTIIVPGRKGCTAADKARDEAGRAPIWAPAVDDPRRKLVLADNDPYPYRKRINDDWFREYPDIGETVDYWAIRSQPSRRTGKFTICSSNQRPEKEPVAPDETYDTKAPLPGNQDRRNSEKNQKKPVPGQGA